jgi:hypothetical protein
MNTFKNFVIIVFSLLVGSYIGLYIYRHKDINELKEVSINQYKIYLLQYGVFKKKENMIEAGSKLSDYFYFKDKDGYHIIIGITENKELEKKIRESYNITENIYLKEVNINNMEFMESLRQYDILIEKVNSPLALINAEKQILSKYEELILNSE